MATLKQLEEKAERIATEYERKERALYRGDGEPFYGKQEMKERTRALEDERSEALAPVAEEAHRIGEEASAKARAARNADPADRLSAEELSKANERRGFANDFAESAEVRELAARCQSVLQGGDKAAVFAWWMAGESRKRRILENRRAANPSTNNRSTDLDDVLGGMEKLIVGEGRDEEAERVAAQEREALRVEMLASNLKQGARTAAGAWEKNLSRRLQRAG